MSDDGNKRRRFMRRLRERSILNQKAGAAKITGGSGDEPTLEQWVGSNGVHCRRLPDDEQGLMRISIGGSSDAPVPLSYTVLRGDIGKCIDLLEASLAALRERHNSGKG